MADHNPFAPQRAIPRIEDCDFYHTMDLPGYGCVAGAWDLRNGIERYLAGFRFAGQRVLDVGAATGYLSFHMERNGADVISYDLSPDHRWDIVPFAGTDLNELHGSARQHVRRYNNGYWFCHHALQSRARVAYGTVYAIPAAIGQVDVATCGSILLHLRDPFLALHNVARITRHTMIVADMIPRRRFLRWCLGRCFGPAGTLLLGRRPKFLPSSGGNKHGASGWWELTPGIVRQFLAVLGFEDSRVTYHSQVFEGRRRLMFTLVGHRTQAAATVSESSLSIAG
jgi:SAM-dependent methyltransferase